MKHPSFFAASSKNLFHDHLDECDHCREHPFDLCVDGKAAMQAEISRMSSHFAAWRTTPLNGESKS